jgi:hypothetical protein
MKRRKNFILAIILSTAAATGNADDNADQAVILTHLNDMKEELSLSYMQVSKIKAAQENLEKYNEEREALQNKIDTILTPEQHEKAKKILAERNAQFQENHVPH